MSESECVRCGYCCQASTCAFGFWNLEQGRCAYLAGTIPGEYRCLIYEAIRERPEAKIDPAFGAGCSSPLFNTDRETAIRRRKERGGNGR